MKNALKVTMTGYGAVGTLFGLWYIILPRQAIEIQSPNVVATAYLVSTKMALGASISAAGSFLVIGARDLVRHLLWAKFAVVFATLFLAVALYSGFFLYGDVSQALVGIIIHGVAAAALLAFYPWSGGRSREQKVSSKPSDT
jgi:hypothetical protein